MDFYFLLFPFLIVKFGVWWMNSGAKRDWCDGELVMMNNMYRVLMLLLPPVVAQSSVGN